MVEENHSHIVVQGQKFIFIVIINLIIISKLNYIILIYYFKFYNSSEFGVSSRLEYIIDPETNEPIFEDETLETYFTLQRVETAISGIDKLVTDLLEICDTVNGVAEDGNYMNLPNDTLDGGAVPVLFGSKLYIIKVK